MIEKNLERLFKEIYDQALSVTIPSLIEKLISETNEQYVEMGITNYLQGEEAAALLSYKNDEGLIQLYEEAKKIDIPEREIVDKLKIDLNTIFTSIRKKLGENTVQKPIQSLIIEYNYHPYGYIYCCGIGSYPILKNPKEISHDFPEVLFTGKENIDFSEIWEKIFELEEFFEEFEYGEFILDMESFQLIKKAIKLKTAKLLNKALEEIDHSIFDSDMIRKPFYIYLSEQNKAQLSILKISGS